MTKPITENMSTEAHIITANRFDQDLRRMQRFVLLVFACFYAFLLYFLYFKIFVIKNHIFCEIKLKSNSQ